MDIYEVNKIALELLKEAGITVEDIDNELREYRKRKRIEKSLENSLKQMELMREGKMPKKNWKQFYSEMKKESGGS